MSTSSALTEKDIASSSLRNSRICLDLAAARVLPRRLSTAGRSAPPRRSCTWPSRRCREQVRALEAELGVALFTRAGRGLQPTEAGRDAAPARRARRCTRSRPRASRSSPCASCAAAPRRSAPGAPRASTPAWTSSPTFRDRHPERARPAARPQLRRGRRGAAQRRRRGRHGRAADRRPRASTCGPVMRDEIVYVERPSPRACAGRSTSPRRRRRRSILPDASYGAMTRRAGSSPSSPSARG